MNLHQKIEDLLDYLDEVIKFAPHRPRFVAACTGAWFRIYRHKHTWRRFAKSSAQRTYYLRDCACGQEQIQSAGPMGDRQWHNLQNHVWRHQWEWQDFCTAREPNP